LRNSDGLCVTRVSPRSYQGRLKIGGTWFGGSFCQASEKEGVVSVPRRRLPSKPNIIEVPLALLLSKELTPAAKLLWIRLRFEAMQWRQRSHSPSRLAERTGLARSTIYEALRQAADVGWLIPYVDKATGKRRWKVALPVREPRGVVYIPVDLIRATDALRPQSILCYGILQATPDFKPRGMAGSFKWAQLRQLTGLHLRTLKRAVRELADARWIALAQRHRKAPIRFRLQHADQAYKVEVERRLERAQYVGESIMREFLSLLVPTNECEDGARPGFLVNPATGERLELDRYYPLHRVAFEFNGKQHYEPTGRFTREEVAAQKKRDRIKREICRQKGITLVVVHAEDLTLKGMLAKLNEVDDLLPRRSLRMFKRTVRFLNECGRRYSQKAVSSETNRRSA
jgi:hypothetical protein